MRVSRDGSTRPGLSKNGLTGGHWRLLSGKKSTNLRTSAKASTSFSKAPSATEDFLVWVEAPPSSSALTISFVTVLTTSGPVTNMYELSLTIKMKSVIAGEYTAPPAHGPMITLICGTTPEAMIFL